MAVDLSPVAIPAGSGLGSGAGAAAGAGTAGASAFAGSEPPGGAAASSAKHNVVKRTIPSPVKRLKHRRLDFPRFIFPPLFICSKSLNCVRPSFTGADTNDFLDRGNKYLAVSYFSRARPLHDRFDYLGRFFIGHENLDLHLR